MGARQTRSSRVNAAATPAAAIDPLYAAIVSSADDAIFTKQLDGTITSWNPGAERIYGYAAEEVVGQSVAILAPPEHPDEIPAILARVASGERIEHFETVRVRRDGSRRDVSLTISPIRDHDGRIIAASTVARDITERNANRAAIAQADHLFRLVIDGSPNPMIAVDGDGLIVYVNPRVAGSFGYAPEEILGQPIEILVPTRLRDRHVVHRRAYAAAPVARPMGMSLDLAGQRRDGSEFPVEISLAPVETADGLQTFATVVDISARKAAENELLHAQKREQARLEAELRSAHHDELTGVYRREMGRLALAREIERSRRSDGRFVLAFVDVDGLKGINDRHGHAAGDQVLRTVVHAIRTRLRSFDPVIRYGGDEFVCGLGGTDLAEAERRFGAIGLAVEAEAGVGISVGLAALAAGDTVDQLTERADAAMLEIKAEHRSRGSGTVVERGPAGS